MSSNNIKSTKPFKAALLTSCLLSALSLSGCIGYSTSEAVKPLAKDLNKGGFVSEIEIKSLPADAPPEFKDKLMLALQTQLKKCATGDHPLRLEARVAELKGQNGFKTVLIGDSNVIRGSVQLFEPNSTTAIADYDINRSVGGGGLFALAGLSGADGKNAQAFADQVCDQVFKH